MLLISVSVICNPKLKFTLPKNSHKMLCISACSIALILCSFYIPKNKLMIGIDKATLPQVQITDILQNIEGNNLQDKHILVYSSLDATWYTLPNLPSCTYYFSFCKVIEEEGIAEENAVLNNAEIDYVIVLEWEENVFDNSNFIEHYDKIGKFYYPNNYIYCDPEHDYVVLYKNNNN